MRVRQIAPRKLLRRATDEPHMTTTTIPELPVAVGGSGSGQHTLGEAADIHVDGMSNLDLARHIRAINLEVDQVIGYAETGHVHVSHRAAGRQRKQFLWCANLSKRQFEAWSVGCAP